MATTLHPGEALLTAHHLEDQLETVLLQLLRGAGLPGLAAMPAVMPLGTGFLVRPLLSVPRRTNRIKTAQLVAKRSEIVVALATCLAAEMFICPAVYYKS